MSVGGRLARNWFSGQMRGCLAQLLATVAVLSVVVCSGLAASFAPKSVQPLAFGAAFLLGFGAVIGAIICWGLWNRWRIGQQLGAAFLSLPLKNPTSSGWLLIGRQYHGTLSGRQFDAWFNKGPTLEIYLGCNGRTRTGFAMPGTLSNMVGGLAGRTTFEAPDLGVTVLAADAAWSRELLRDADARDGIRTLSETVSGGELRSVSVMPASVMVTSRYTPIDEMTPENVQKWADALEKLAGAVDRAPNPGEVVEESALEADARSSRKKAMGCAIGIVVAIFGGVLLLFIPVVIGLVFFSGGR